MTERSGLLRQEYVARVNRVIDYIDSHLGAELSLPELASAACFSRFHFRRIFSALVGETIVDCIKGVRLENAAFRLLDNPGDSITDIAMRCGFSSPSAFVRAFRERFGASASRRRANGGRAPADGGEGAIDRGQGAPRAPRRLCAAHRCLPGNRAGVREADAVGRPARSAPVHRDEEPGGLSRQSRRHRDGQAALRCVHHRPRGHEGGRGDRRDAHPRRHLRRGALRDRGRPVQGGLGRPQGGRLPGSGYQPDERMCYEVYLNDPEQHPQRRFVINICEPAKPL